MTKVNTTFYGWSWGEVQFEWTIVGPFKTTGDAYTKANCGAPTFTEDADTKFRLGPAAALSSGVNVSSYDFQVYWQPYCSGSRFVGLARVGGVAALLNGPWPFDTLTRPRADGSWWSEVLAHELGHNFGAHHASCISNGKRGAVAWCDSDVTIKSGNGDSGGDDCSDVAAGWTEYCSPYSIMGAPGSVGLTRPFYMDGKLTFDWADSVSHPTLVSSIDWDSATNKYTGCDTSCTFSLQRSDAATLDNAVSAVILLQTTHSSSNGNRYFVMEHRYDTPVLLIHWTDIDPDGGTTGTYGNTVLTDCNPGTATWDDAGCSLGQHIELDAGDESASMKVWVYVYRALENGKLKVTLSTGVAAVPPLPPPPPALPPSPPGFFMGYPDYNCPCSEFALAGTSVDGTYSLIQNPENGANDGKLVYQHSSGRYMYFFSSYGKWVVGSDYKSGSANLIGKSSTVECPTELTDWSVTCSTPLPPASPPPRQPHTAARA